MVLEVTSNNYQNDLRVKVAACAIAEIPVYVIVDRKHQRLHVLSAPGKHQPRYKSTRSHPRRSFRVPTASVARLR